MFTTLTGTAATGAAAIVFLVLPPSQVLVGMHPVELTVPWHYQVAVFPCFGMWIGGVAVDLAGSSLRRSMPAVVLTALLTMMAFARLGGRIPLSGHAMCCAALIAMAWVGARRVESGVLAAAAFACCLLTAYHKLAIWHDGWWFGVSTFVGAMTGMSVGWWDRKVMGSSKLSTR